MNHVLSKLLSSQQQNYILINQGWVILEMSAGISHFTEVDGEIKPGEDIRFYLPELIGLEHIVRNILQGKQTSFELKGVVKFSQYQKPLYLNIYLFKYNQIAKNNHLVILIDDATETIKLHQNLSQKFSECSLESDNLSQSQDYIETIISSMSDALLVTTKTGIIKQVNQIVLDLLEYQKYELIGRSITTVFESQENNYLNIEERIFPQDFLGEEIEITCYKKTGQKLAMKFSGSALNSQLEQKYQEQLFVFLGRDITKQKQAEKQQQQQLEQDRLLKTIIQQIHQSLQLESILRTIVKQIQQFLGCDRVLIYRYLSKEKGEVVVEASLPESCVLNDSLDEATTPEQKLISLEENLASLYGIIFNQLGHFLDQNVSFVRSDKVWAIDDIYNHTHHTQWGQKHINLLAQFQIRAELVAPIWRSGKIWGLLIAHNCCTSRQWKQGEIELIEQLTEELEIAINQAELYEKLEAANRELLKLTTLDELTQLSNRRHFNQYIYKEWRRLAREQQPLSLIMCDVDYFKVYNDTYGHMDGDFCLQRVATTFKDSIERPADLAARYGGEEFAIILPNTELEGALQVAETIRHRVKAMQIPHLNSPVSDYVTLSLGVASQIPQLGYLPETLINLADQALYEAKKQGRDQLCCRF